MDFLEKVYEALGEEGLKKARWKQKVMLIEYPLAVISEALYVGLWLFTPLGDWALRVSCQEGWPLFLKVLVYVGLFLFGSALFGFPFSYLRRWVAIQTGTNRQSFGDWLVEWVKTTLLATGFYTLLFAEAYWLYLTNPRLAFWGAIVLAALFVVAALFLSPVFFRMRYKTEPLEDPEKVQAIREVFEKAGVPFRGVSLARASEKTTAGNAAVLPSRKGYEVVVFDTLLEALDTDALKFVVAHELGHIRHRDILKFAVVQSFSLALALIVGYLLAGSPKLENFPLFYLGVIYTLYLIPFFSNAYSRKAEYAADRYAIRLVPDLGAFERGFVVLYKQNILDPDPPAWYEALFYDHPSAKRRHEALKKALDEIKGTA